MAAAIPEKVHATDDVFGVSRDLPLNYVTRETVDGKFVDSLARKQHIVIYGSSKQGKTSLRKQCLQDQDYVVVSCQNRWLLGELHSAILKECGFTIKQSSEKSVSGKNKVIAEVAAKAKFLLLLEGAGKAAYEHENENSTTEVHVPWNWIQKILTI